MSIIGEVSELHGNNHMEVRSNAIICATVHKTHTQNPVALMAPSQTPTLHRRIESLLGHVPLYHSVASGSPGFASNHRIGVGNHLRPEVARAHTNFAGAYARRFEAGRLHGGVGTDFEACLG